MVASSCSPYLRAAFELLRVFANSEMSAPAVARAAQHDAAQILVAVELAHDLPEALPHAQVERVQPLRVAERDGGDIAVAGEEDLAWHGPRP
jgi:hypothetical protein